MEEVQNTGKKEWIGYEKVGRGSDTLIVHAYEVAGEQWKHGFEIYLVNRDKLEMLYESDRIYYKRERAMDAGKEFAKSYRYKMESKLLKILRRAIGL